MRHREIRKPHSDKFVAFAGSRSAKESGGQGFGGPTRRIWDSVIGWIVRIAGRVDVAFRAIKPGGCKLRRLDDNWTHRTSLGAQRPDFLLIGSCVCTRSEGSPADFPAPRRCTPKCLRLRLRAREKPGLGFWILIVWNCQPVLVGAVDGDFVRHPIRLPRAAHSVGGRRATITFRLA